jgi:glutathionyl-hydroquinone reductase
LFIISFLYTQIKANKESKERKKKMGLLVAGKWQNQWYDTKSTDGQFVRKASSFRNWITPQGEFQAAAGRYHLYVSLACPWAHRTLILRKLKGLEAMISVSVVNAFMGDLGWSFEPGEEVIPDSVNQASHLHQIYTLAQKDYTGRVTVPVLWDKQSQTIVSNESADIIRMFNSAFDHLGATPGDYYPEALRPEIDALNQDIYENINNGVYRAGFATTQAAYDQAVSALFEALDRLEKRLETQRYLTGAQITEADWRLFTTLVRFDPVYVGHFKCNIRRLSDYPHLSAYLRDLYQTPGIADTVKIEHIKAHYYGSHESINPTRIIPIGSGPNLNLPHNRQRLDPIPSKNLLLEAHNG